MYHWLDRTVFYKSQFALNYSHKKCPVFGDFIFHIFPSLVCNCATFVVLFMTVIDSLMSSVFNSFNSTFIILIDLSKPFSAVDGVNVNESLLKEGFAWQYRKYCKARFCSKWFSHEKTAKKARLGLWKDQFAQAPWEYRKAKRTGTKSASKSISAAKQQGYRVHKQCVGN